MDKKNGKKKKEKNNFSDSSSLVHVVIEKNKDKEMFESSSSDHVETDKKDKELKAKKRKSESPESKKKMKKAAEELETSENPKKEKKNGPNTFHNMKKTLVWFDLENCRVPHDLDPEEVYPRMKKTLREDGYGGKLEIKIVMPFTDCEVPEGLLKKMRLVRVRDCPRPEDPNSIDKNDNQIVDQFIERDITKWLSLRPEPHNVMIPSSDGDFRKIALMVKENGHSFLMAYDDNPTGKNQKKESSAKMLKLAERAWTWRKLLRLPKSQLNEDLRWDNKFLHREFLKKNKGPDGMVDPEIYANFMRELAERKRLCIEAKEGDMSFSQEFRKLKREKLERELAEKKRMGMTDEEIKKLKLKVYLEAEIFEELKAKYERDAELRWSGIKAKEGSRSAGIVISEGNVEEKPVEQKWEKQKVKGKEKVVDEEDDKEFAERANKIARKLKKKQEGPGGSDI